MKEKASKNDKAKKATGISKKEIRAKIQESVNKAITGLHAVPSKKTKKSVKKVSNKIAGKIKKDLKKNKAGKKVKINPLGAEKPKAEIGGK